MANTMEMTQGVALKDYIIDLPEAQARTGASYEVILQNNTDFIVRRRTQKRERELVILISKGLYYLKDCKGTAIDTVTEGSLNSFLRDMKDGVLPMDQVHWLSYLCKEAGTFIFKVISDDTITEMCRHGVMNDMKDPDWFCPYWEQNSKLFIRLHKLFPTLTDHAKYQASIPIIFWIEGRYGTNEAVYFANQLAQSGIKDITTFYSYDIMDRMKNITVFTKLFEGDYNLNLRRFTDFILFDLYRQGYGVLNHSFFTEYEDYLRMQKDLYGKIKEKYPENFKTAHDVLALKVAIVKSIAQCEDFAEQAEEIKDLAYQGRNYCVTIPTEPKELADEGINLSHCVADYIDRVASGACHILFLRRRNAPDRSLVTLQLSGTCLCQAQGQNRRHITNEERRFLEQWCKEKKLELAV